MPDFGMLSSGLSSIHGVTRNPWNTARNTSGSSSGAGAAAAAAGSSPPTLQRDKLFLVGDMKQSIYRFRGADLEMFAAARALAALGAELARLALSLGLSRNFKDDHEMLKRGLVMYDALYAWCKEGQDETHTWNVTA